MTTTSKFDDADLGEMLMASLAAQECGYYIVQSDAQVQIDLITELIELRKSAGGYV